MALRFWGIPANVGETSFTDVPEDHWARELIVAAAVADYVTGYADGSFRPEGNISRAEAVTILNRIIGCEGVTGGTTFSDVAERHWAFAAITGAATDHNHLDE